MTSDTAAAVVVASLALVVSAEDVTAMDGVERGDVWNRKESVNG